MGSICPCLKSSDPSRLYPEPLTGGIEMQNKSNSTSASVNVDKDILVGQGEGRLEDDYTLTKKLGEGSYGAVFLATNKTTGEKRAIKRLLKPKGYDSKKVSEEIKNEIGILTSLDHQNIMKVYGYYETEKDISIVTELCAGGELFDKVTTLGFLDEITAATIMFQLFGAISYCNEKNIMHRDLKTENIMLETKKMKGNFRIKLIDFGIAQILDKGEFQQELTGTCYYIAPEVIKKKYDKRCDMFSCGVILYILLTGKLPFCGDSNQEIFDAILSGKYDKTEEPLPKCSEESKNLLESLLKVNPDERITVADALKHPWFDKFKIRDKLSELQPEIIKKLISNIQSYKPQKILQQATLAYIVHNLPNIQEIKDACKLFTKIDKNLNGSISFEEFRDGVNELLDPGEKYQDSELKEMFSKIDSDNTNDIEFEEFARAAADKKILLQENYIKDAFRFFDRDDSGSITLEEIAKVFQRSGQCNISELKSIVNEIDINNDGKVDFKEFSYMMSKILE